MQTAQQKNTANTARIVRTRLAVPGMRSALIMRLGACWLMVGLCCMLLAAGGAFAADPSAGTSVSGKWYSQTVYVPVYSSVFFGNQKKKGPKTFNVAATVTIRNTDLANSVQVDEVRYFNGDGKEVRQYLPAVRDLGPMEIMEVVVDEADMEGGVGASFIIRWRALEPVTEPVVQAVMIGTQSSQGISFVTEGRVLEGTRR